MWCNYHDLGLSFSHSCHENLAKMMDVESESLNGCLEGDNIRSNVIFFFRSFVRTLFLSFWWVISYFALCVHQFRRFNTINKQLQYLRRKNVCGAVTHITCSCFFPLFQIISIACLILHYKTQNFFHHEHDILISGTFVAYTIILVALFAGNFHWILTLFTGSWGRKQQKAK